MMHNDNPMALLYTAVTTESSSEIIRYIPRDNVLDLFQDNMDPKKCSEWVVHIMEKDEFIEYVLSQLWGHVDWNVFLQQMKRKGIVVIKGTNGNYFLSHPEFGSSPYSILGIDNSKVSSDLTKYDLLKMCTPSDLAELKKKTLDNHYTEKQIDNKAREISEATNAVIEGTGSRMPRKTFSLQDKSDMEEEIQRLKNEIRDKDQQLNEKNDKINRGEIRVQRMNQELQQLHGREGGLSRWEGNLRRREGQLGQREEDLNRWEWDLRQREGQFRRG